jgi:ferredoxin
MLREDIVFARAYLSNRDWYQMVHIKEVSSMAYIINDDCISCGACEAECPTSAISEGDGKYEINPDVCTECGSCADVCPVGAPQPE